jgi:RNA polymerase sigma-70 factor (ECF subfamily)
MATCAPEAADEEAWNWLEARAVCLRVALRCTRDASDAEDVAQEAAIRAWRRRDALRDDLRRDEWLSRITRNEAHRLRERTGREHASEEPLRGSESDRSLEQLIDGAPVREALAGLGRSERELLGLRYEDDLTQRAIADRLGVPEGTVKVRLHRLRTKLRATLGD